MIIVIMCKETDPKTGRSRTVVSHGIDSNTGKVVIISNDSPENIGAIYDHNIGEFVIPDSVDTPTE